MLRKRSLSPDAPTHSEMPDAHARLFQHAMVIDSRNSSIMPRRGALLKVNQVPFLRSV